MPGVPLTPDELLTTTRSVRKRLDLTRPVPLDLVQECLEIALQAPNGGMREGWHWIVVTDPQVRAQIGNFYRRSAEPYLASAAAADPSRGAGSGVMARVSSSSAYLARHMGQVPVLVIPCITVRPALLPGAEGADERCVVRADGAGRENPAGRCCGGVFIGEVPVVVGMVPVVSVDDLGDCGAGSGFVDEVLA